MTLPSHRDETPFFSVVDLLADIRERITRGVGRLEDAAKRTTSEHEQARLGGKVEGLLVVLDMLERIERAARQFR